MIVAAEECLALRQRDRMRIDPADLTKGHTRQGDQMMRDADDRLTGHLQGRVEEQVMDPVDRTGDGVLDRRHGVAGAARLGAPEQRLEIGAGSDPRSRAE